MEKDIGNFLEWCEDRGKSTASLCRMSDDEIRDSELFDEYRSHLMLLKNYFRIAGDEYVDPEYRDLNRGNPFETTGLDYISLFLLLFALILLGLGCAGVFD